MTVIITLQDLILMRNITIDFYTKFEGENEIIFLIKSDNYEKRLRIWSCYFDEIMMKIEPSEDHGWTGLAYYSHLLIGWHTEINWQIPDLTEALFQFQSVKLPQDDPDNNLDYETDRKVLVEIINMILEALEEKIPVYILEI